MRQIKLVPILRVQGMSDGWEIVQPIVDDFTGEVIQPVAPASKPRPLASSTAWDQARRQVQVAQAALMLQALGLSGKYGPAAPAGNKGNGLKRKD